MIRIESATSLPITLDPTVLFAVQDSQVNNLAIQDDRTIFAETGSVEFKHPIARDFTFKTRMPMVRTIKQLYATAKIGGARAFQAVDALQSMARSMPYKSCVSLDAFNHLISIAKEESGSIGSYALERIAEMTQPHVIGNMSYSHVEAEFLRIVSHTKTINRSIVSHLAHISMNSFLAPEFESFLQMRTDLQSDLVSLAWEGDIHALLALYRIDEQRAFDALDYIVDERKPPGKLQLFIDSIFDALNRAPNHQIGITSGLMKDYITTMTSQSLDVWKHIKAAAFSFLEDPKQVPHNSPGRWLPAIIVDAIAFSNTLLARDAIAYLKTFKRYEDKSWPKI